MQYRHVQSIGGKGSGPDRFSATLRGLAAGHEQIYAAGDSEIKIFDAAGALKKPLPTSRPVLSVAVDKDGTVYAGQLRQIEIFDGGGKLLHTWQDDKLLGR